MPPFFLNQKTSARFRILDHGYLLKDVPFPLISPLGWWKLKWQFIYQCCQATELSDILEHTWLFGMTLHVYPVTVLKWFQQSCKIKYEVLFTLETVKFSSIFIGNIFLKITLKCCCGVAIQVKGIDFQAMTGFLTNHKSGQFYC